MRPNSTSEQVERCLLKPTSEFLLDLFPLGLITLTHVGDVLKRAFADQLDGRWQVSRLGPLDRGESPVVEQTHDAVTNRLELGLRGRLVRVCRSERKPVVGFQFEDGVLVEGVHKDDYNLDRGGRAGRGCNEA